MVFFFFFCFTELVSPPSDDQDDAQVLDEMGYKQDLFRGVTGWFMNFSFTFTAVSIISSYSILFSYGKANFFFQKFLV